MWSGNGVLDGTHDGTHDSTHGSTVKDTHDSLRKDSEATKNRCDVCKKTSLASSSFSFLQDSRGQTSQQQQPVCQALKERIWVQLLAPRILRTKRNIDKLLENNPPIPTTRPLVCERCGKRKFANQQSRERHMRLCKRDKTVLTVNVVLNAADVTQTVANVALQLIKQAELHKRLNPDVVVVHSDGNKVRKNACPTSRQL